MKRLHASARRGLWREPRLAVAAVLALASVAAMALSACTPTVRVEVAPINIYAKLDANVRVRLDREVQSAIEQNPGLF